LVKAFDAGKLEFFSSLQSLRDQHTFSGHLAPTREAEWVVCAKRPFAGPEQVLDYVGRYTHRVAISNNRLLDISEGEVTFRYKDYRHDAQHKTMTLEAEEFIRRFLIPIVHALGNGLVQPFLDHRRGDHPPTALSSIFRRDAGLKMLCIWPIGIEPSWIRSNTKII
jgi:hypothetical protein